MAALSLKAYQHLTPGAQLKMTIRLREGSLLPKQRIQARPVELVIFDFDGTLADSFGWFSKALNQSAQRWGFRPIRDRDQAEALRNLGASEILRELGVARWKVPLIARDLRTRMGREIGGIRPFEGVPEMLARLAGADRRLAIASSNAAGNIHQVLGPRCMSRFDALESGIGLGAKHRRLARICRRLNVEPEATIYIGDELRDVQAARRAGISAGAVTWGYNRESALLAGRPQILFRSVTEISAVLCARRPRTLGGARPPSAACGH